MHPVVRAGSSNSELVDPASEATYNMGNLFLNNVPINPKDDSCIPLDIVTDNAAGTKTHTCHEQTSTNTKSSGSRLVSQIMAIPEEQHSVSEK
jgi:hypothetical protein